MYRSVFAAFGGLALVVSSLFTPSILAAKRCPVEPPSTLLALYKRSDAIYIGTFDKSAPGKVIQDEADYSVTEIVEHFTISTTLKGEPRKFFERHREEYIYKTTEESAVDEDAALFEDETVSDEGSLADEEPVEEDIGDEAMDEGYRALEEGDVVFLFLRAGDRRDEDGKVILELAHYRDGIKRMPAASVSSYEARVNELNHIFFDTKRNDAAIVAWLIRCIEDPITRWEGAQVLLDGFEQLEWREERAKEEAAEKVSAQEAEQQVAVTTNSTEGSATTEAPIDDDEVVDEIVEAEDTHDYDVAVYAELLTQAQKDALVRLAIKNTPKKTAIKGQTASMSRGDQTLFELAKRWGDYQLAAAMLEWLAVTDNNYGKSDLMASISQILKDKELATISEKFSDVTYQEDTEAVEEETAEGSEVDAAQVPVTNVPVETEPAKPEPGKSEEADRQQPNGTSEPEVDEKPKQTYGQLRSEIFASFVNRANVVLTNEKKAAKKNAKMKSKQAVAAK